MIKGRGSEMEENIFSWQEVAIKHSIIMNLNGKLLKSSPCADQAKLLGICV